MTIFIAALSFMAGGAVGFLTFCMFLAARDADGYDETPTWPDPWGDQDARP